MGTIVLLVVAAAWAATASSAFVDADSTELSAASTFEVN